jgi:DNA-directed RNA polymerase subunit RPC12/RpoP|tara:strand:- start:1707 stop:1892 length:186 start_codon:yes stop_codon:yes gene_type:complete
MKHKVSKEVLYHFNCGKCNKWWSVADYHLLSLNNTKDLNGNKKITCPHCEHKENVIDIKYE